MLCSQKKKCIYKRNVKLGNKTAVHVFLNIEIRPDNMMFMLVVHFYIILELILLE